MPHTYLKVLQLNYIFTSEMFIKWNCISHPIRNISRFLLFKYITLKQVFHIIVLHTSTNWLYFEFTNSDHERVLSTEYLHYSYGAAYEYKFCFALFLPMSYLPFSFIIFYVLQFLEKGTYQILICNEIF